MHAFIWPWPNTVAVVAAAPRAESPAAATDRRPAGRACLDPPPHHGFHLTTWQLGKGGKKRKIRDCGRRAIFRVLFHRSSSSSLGLLLFGSPVRLLFLRCCCVTQESRTRISCVLAPSCMLGDCGTCVRPNSRGTWRPADVGWYKQSECGLISNLKPALDWTCRHLMDRRRRGERRKCFRPLCEVRLGRWGPFFPPYVVRSGEACFCLLVCMPGSIGYHIVRVHICCL